jgi:DNA-binding SARP family transcriptional activator/predicted ATPase/Tfp pilus assembly protein PilF
MGTTTESRAQLELHLFGAPEICLQGQPVTGLSAKTVALLIYLAVTGEAHKRSALAALLWGEVPEKRARANLRKAIQQLRSTFAQFITIERQSLALRRDASIWIDVDEIERAVNTAQVSEDGSAFEDALDLYRGDFLEGVDVRHAPHFDSWLLAQRARLREAMIDGLMRLSQHALTGSNLKQAIAANRRIVELEPWREEAHRRLMELLAQSGQRSAALEHYEQCRRALREELDVEPDAQTTALYARIRKNDMGGGGEDSLQFDTLLGSGTESAHHPRHNIPSDLTPFVGREDSLADVAELLADRDVRLVSITGLGGMGKTRLAQEAARRQFDNFADGVFFVPLVQVEQSASLPGAIADAINLQLRSSDEPRAQLANYLHSKQILLILDNFEHLIGESALVADLLKAAPDVKMLVTTRQSLRLHGETSVPIAGMEIREWLSAAQAASAPVVQLFVRGAQQVRPSFRLTDENLGLVLRICRLVQGMPLGVELAASWLHVFNLAAIARDIEADMDFLRTDFHNLPKRHRSLSTVLEQSLRLLDKGDRDVFLRLCLFRGGFTRAAAEEVAGAGAEALLSLTNKSMIRRESNGRYSIHEMLRQFGEARLRQGSHYDDARDEHCSYYCTLLGNQDNELNCGDAPSACRQIEVELGNVHRAWTWACRRGLYDELLAAEYPLFLFREYQNRFQEVEQLYETAVRRLANFPPSPKRDYVISSVLRSQAWTALRCAQIDRGIDLGLQSREYLAQSGLPLARVSGNDPRAPLAVLYTVRGDYSRARDMGEEMLCEHHERDDGVKVILAYYALSTLEVAEGNYERVRDYGARATECFQATGHRYLWAYFLNNWGNAERALGNYEQAQQLFSQSHEHMRYLESNEGMTTALNNMGHVAILRGEYDTASKILNRNVATYRDLGDVGGVAMTLEKLGLVAYQQGDHGRAAHLYREALEEAGTALPSVSLSILVRVSQLFMVRRQETVACSILATVLHHPATNQEVKERVRLLIDDSGICLHSNETVEPLDTLVDRIKPHLGAIFEKYT